jgi:hypothetical protein
MKKNIKKPEVGRVDFRLLMVNKSSKFEDRRTRRARTRGDAFRREIAAQD